MSTHTFSSDFRRFFGRGLAVLLPSILTLWLLWYAFIFVFSTVAVPINGGIRRLVIQVLPLVIEAPARPAWYTVTPQELDTYRAAQQALGRTKLDDAVLTAEIRRAALAEFWEQRWYLKLSGLVVAITLIYLAGLLLGGLIGRRLYARVERLIARIPGFKQVYPHVKQLVDLVLGEKQMAFRGVVLVQFPLEAHWVIAFVTSTSLRVLRDATGTDHITVFIPTTPTPFTGFTVNVPRSSTIELPITVDEAIRFVLTAGVLVPESQAVSPLSPEARRLIEEMSGARPERPGTAATKSQTRE